MALTKAQIKEILSEAGVPTENIDKATTKILDGHTTSLDYLREEVSKYKGEAEKLPGVQKELDDLKAIKTGDESYKEKYESTKKELDDLKAENQRKATHEAKETALTALLKELGVPETWHKRVLKGVNFDEIELTKDNTLKDPDGLKTAFTSEWGDVITKPVTKGADTAKPPAQTGGGTFKALSLYDKMKYANEHPGDAEVQEWLKNPTAGEKKKEE
jgi:hypothetical protein